jgi:hypothetical protein
LTVSNNQGILNLLGSLYIRALALVNVPVFQIIYLYAAYLSSGYYYQERILILLCEGMDSNAVIQPDRIPHNYFLKKPVTILFE